MIDLQMQTIVRAVAVPRQQTPPPQPGIFDIFMSLLPLIIIGVIIVIILWLISRWLAKKGRDRKDIYKADYHNVISLSKLHKDRMFIKPFMGLPTWIFSTGVPIVLTYPEVGPVKPTDIQEKDKKKLKGMDIVEMAPIGRSEKIGTYRGHCVTPDGCYNIMFASTNDKIFFLFPKIYILKLRQGIRKKIPDYEDSELKKTRVIDIPGDNFKMGSYMINVYCFGLHKVNEYLYPVNMDSEGRVIDNRQIINYDINDTSLQRQVIDFGRSTVYAMDESIRSNPFVQFAKKTEQEGMTQK